MSQLHISKLKNKSRFPSISSGMTMVMAVEMITMVLLFSAKLAAAAEYDGGFIYNGFREDNINVSRSAQITANGLLRLTNTQTGNEVGHAFFPRPLPFRNSTDGKNSTPSFSTTFVIALLPEDRQETIANGMAFLLSPTKELPQTLPGGYLGLFNVKNNGDPSNHILAIEFDTIQNPEFEDIDANHVGIDVNSLISVKSITAGYTDNDDQSFHKFILKNGNPLQVWVDYDAGEKRLNVTLSPLGVPKPNKPLLSSDLNLYSLVLDSMYAGFSASTNLLLTSHYVLAWSFKMNGQAPPLDLSLLPELPKPKETSRLLKILLPIAVIILLVAISAIVVTVVRRVRYSEVFEDWETKYGPQRFAYKDLYIATKGFKETALLGEGGSGKVYKGTMPSTNMQIAVKKISHDSPQGMTEFVAEIATIGRIRHADLVRLQGYCRRKGELILVYDFMPRGSLDKYLYNQSQQTLDWTPRFRIVKQVASGLAFLHEQWQQVVVHRDIKAGNVLLDQDYNAKLGDFGLSRLYDHGCDPQTTCLAGTPGYIAPELNRNGRANPSTDIYAFGVFLLEVACGRRPIQLRAEPAVKMFVVDWVIDCLRRGSILEAADEKLGNVYIKEEMELVLQLGLLCTLDSDAARPSIGQIVQFLNRKARLPLLPTANLRPVGQAIEGNTGNSPIQFMSSPALNSVTVLYGGR